MDRGAWQVQSMGLQSQMCLSTQHTAFIQSTLRILQRGGPVPALKG